MHDINKIKISGYCHKCGKTHLLESSPAYDESLKLIKTLEIEKCIDFSAPIVKRSDLFSTDYLFGKAYGQMFGVMVYKDSNGQVGSAKAFSGQYNGQWQVEGWVDPIISVPAFNEIIFDTEKEIKQIGRELESLTKGSTLYLHKKEQRKKLSQQLMKDIHGLYHLSNFKGETKSMVEVVGEKKGIPTGTGDCCGPKLLNYAVKNKLTPIGIAEFYFGLQNRSRTKDHKVFYSSCEGKCGLILGYMLCGL